MMRENTSSMVKYLIYLLLINFHSTIQATEFLSLSGDTDGSICTTVNCDITIISSANSILISIKNVTTQNPNCDYDTIEIKTYNRNRGYDEWSSRRYLCYKENLPVILSPGKVRLVFYSYYERIEKGMNISWAPFDDYESLSMEKPGVLLSPGYPEYFINAIGDNWSYIFDLKPPNGSYTHLKLTDFNSNRGNNYLELRNGLSDSLPFFYASDPDYHTYDYANELILGPTSIILDLQFSNLSSGSYGKISFRLFWTFELCHKKVNVTKGKLESPFSPKNFIMDNTYIQWMIDATQLSNSMIMWNISLSDSDTGFIELRKGFSYSSKVIWSSSESHRRCNPSRDTNELNPRGDMEYFKKCSIISFLISTENSELYIRYNPKGYTHYTFEVTWNIEQCPMKLDSTEGILQSHGFPLEFMGYNYECGWIVSPELPQHSKIMLNFTHFSTKNSDSYMEIRDGQTILAPLIKKISGEHLQIPRMFSSGDQLYLQFTSGNDTSFSSRFKLHWSVEMCRMDLESTKGVIISPEYPNTYPINLRYIWTITTYSYTKIKIIFFTFDTLDINNFLDIRGVKNGSSTLIKKFYGRNQTILDIIYPGNTLFLTFKTDNNTVCKGFEMSWEIVYGDKFTSPSGILHSPGFPIQYPNDLLSTWTITSLNNARIRLTFSNFDTEYFVDNLEIRNGILRNSPLITRLSGRNLTLSDMVSPGSELFLRFTTDHSHNFRGFQISWSEEDNSQEQDVIIESTVTCLLNGCPENAECVLNMNSRYKCTCKHGYTGFKCQPTCLISGCPENAECDFNMNNQYECTCKEQYTGHHCQHVNIGQGDMSSASKLLYSIGESENSSNTSSVVTLLVLIFLLMATLVGLALYVIYHYKNSNWRLLQKAEFTANDGENIECRVFPMTSDQTQDDH